MKKCIAILFSASCMLSLAYAETQVTKCPSVESIAATGWTIAKEEENNPGYWGVGMQSAKYDTEQEWSFLFGDVQAKDSNDALQKATLAAKNLKLFLGPLGDEEMSVCYYNSSNSHLVGIAVTPAVPFQEMRDKAETM